MGLPADRDWQRQRQRETEIERHRERHRERKRERKREIERKKDTDRKRQREIQRQTEGQRKKERDRERDSQEKIVSFRELTFSKVFNVYQAFEKMSTQINKVKINDTRQHRDDLTRATSINVRERSSVITILWP